jgi:hypothetical protein
VDPFALVIFGGIGVIVACLWLLGRYYPGNGLEQIGQRSAQQITESREQLEAEDLQQMILAHNTRRRARGRSEVTQDDLERRVAEDFRDQQRRREELLGELELEQLMTATNARRRARGLPERTRSEVEAEFGRSQAAPGSLEAASEGGRPVGPAKDAPA